jgi:hypothetical protein
MKKLFAALAYTAFVAIGVVAAGGAQATTQVPLSPVSEQNAVRTAQEYLKMDGFSRQGLIDQLVHDEYSEADATAAVDSLAVNWSEQAVRTAKAYLKMDSFSHGGLVDQLEHDGYTASQAEYGVEAVGL